jgi:hypothetical protein
VVITRAQEAGNGNDPVAAGAILHHNRLPPSGAEPIAQQSRADIDAGAGTERNHELDRSLRPSLRRRGRGVRYERCKHTQDEDKRARHAAHDLLHFQI